MALRKYPLEAGERSWLVTVEKKTASTGTGGFPVETWATHRQMWMSKRQVSGDEKFQAEQMAAQYDTIWETDYRADLDPELVELRATFRLDYQGRKYDIVDGAVIFATDNPKAGIELTTLAGARTT